MPSRLPPPLPEPYTMCCQQEGEDRQRSGEISPLERRWSPVVDGDRKNSSGSSNDPEARLSTTAAVDPRRLVSKFRRSERRYAPRSLPQLEATVEYLAQLLVVVAAVGTNRHRGVDDGDDCCGCDTPWGSVVDFVEDRLRAVQVDLTRLRAASKPLQRRAARIHLLILYLMLQRQGEQRPPAPPAQQQDGRNNIKYYHYERQFGQSALRAALAGYWQPNGGGGNGSHSDEPDATTATSPSSLSCRTTTRLDDDERILMDDEMLSVTLLVQLNEQLLELQQRAGDGDVDDDGTMRMPNFCFALTDLCRRHGPNGELTVLSNQQQQQQLSRLRWTLHLVSLVVMGQWQSAVHHLLAAVPPHNSNQHDSSDDREDHTTTCASSMQSFQTLAQCCLAPSVAWMRWKALQAWNRSIGTPTQTIAGTARTTTLVNEGLSGSELARLLGFATADAALAFAGGKICGLPVDEAATTAPHEEARVRFKVQPVRPFPQQQQQQQHGSIRNDLDPVVFAAPNDRSSNNSSSASPMQLRKTCDGIVLPSREWMRQFLLLT